jgi:ABC-2 type transport system permease protein
MGQLMTDVRRGTLDYTLTKPEDAQFLVSISQFRIWKVTDFVLGGIVLFYALFNRGLEVGVVDAITFGLVLLCGAATIYSFFLILSTISFWYIKVENILNIFDAVVQAGRWPIGIYPHWLRFMLTFIVPIAFAITVPARALTGRLDSESLTAAILVAAGMLIASRLFWRWGLRHYSGASA